MSFLGRRTSDIANDITLVGLPQIWRN